MDMMMEEGGVSLGEGALVLTDNEGVNMEGAVLVTFVQFVGAVASGYLFCSLWLYKSLF